MSEAFLEVCARGDIEAVTSLIDQNRRCLYEKDTNGRNCLLVAVSEGRWKVALKLLRTYKVSPHVIDKDGNSIFHLIVNGTCLIKPTQEDYSEIRQEHLAIWRDEENSVLSRLAAMKETIKDSRPPTKILLKRVEEMDAEFFEIPEIFFPRYILEKYHVVLERKNGNNKNPAELATENNIEELARYYEEQLDYHPTRRRLLQGLNDNLIREVASYL
ncbi:hypothetical protein SteCoe_34218 [Stentor coeruleus]|uniref:Uncharacterized protein n=1 Tax=Stentor coeruleus TaxID=5963 RepID=A0A1R2AV07_9CILI|nr:hypothetical protein SteCoe_34218 [Stentor coeruleus]